MASVNHENASRPYIIKGLISIRFLSYVYQLATSMLVMDAGEDLF